MAENRKYRFNDEEIEALASLTPEQVRDAWKQIHPSLENATYMTAQDGSIEFRVEGGTKG